MPASSKSISDLHPIGITYEDPATSSRIELAPNVLALLDSKRQLKFWDKERGGLLFVDIGVQDRVLVADASPPHRLDKAGRASLVLDHGRCLEDIKERFESGLRFVGYWHTHPERVPSISGDDIYAFTRNLRDRGLRLRQMLALVVGILHGSDGISAYLVSNKRVRQLKSIP